MKNIFIIITVVLPFLCVHLVALGNESDLLGGAKMVEATSAEAEQHANEIALVVLTANKRLVSAGIKLSNYLITIVQSAEGWSVRYELPSKPGTVNAGGSIKVTLGIGKEIVDVEQEQ